MNPTRGERNNNPGNIDRNAIKWQGMAPDQSGDARFVVFLAPVWGVRAMAMELLHYYERDGDRTVRQMINRWAPPVENDTGAYVAAVAAQCCVMPDAAINPHDPETLMNLVSAIIRHENGRVIYDSITIANGITRALA